jgi:hypothetical protein
MFAFLLQKESYACIVEDIRISCLDIHVTMMVFIYMRHPFVCL